MDLTAFDTSPQDVYWAATIFSGLVLIIFWFEYRRTRGKLFVRENQMKRRMYELSILRELGERIGYSLNVQKIIDIIRGSLGKLLPYSIVAYMLPNEDGRLIFNVALAEPVSKSFVAEVKTRMLKSFSALFDEVYSADDIDESISGVVTDPANPAKVESLFNVPIVINNRPAGIFTVAATKPDMYKTSEEVEILYTIMNQASEAVSKLETVLEVEKGKLNAMVASMADGVLMVDNQNRLIVVNPQTLAMLGITVPEPTIFDVLDTLSEHFDLRTKIEESRRKDKLIVEQEIEIDEHFLQILISPVKDRKGLMLGSVVLFHDITHDKELEKMREDFTSMMVHELRSPLTGIRSIASLLTTDKVKNEEKKYKEFVELISNNSNSMLELVNDLLDVSKLESGKFEIFKRPGDLRHTIEQRIKSLNALAQENKITLQYKVLPEMPQTLQFDENKIGQVLNNLLSNAIKFSLPGGEVMVAAFFCKKSQDLPQQAANFGLPWQGLKAGAVCAIDAVVVSVSDSGVGIPAREIGKLFNKFQQLSTAMKSEKKGTGLGLVIVKGVVEAHGGQVGVFSEEGKGTTFYFTIPV
ncbi:MAG: ATP-binding protein [bacterium]|nr:ATP-binding protein [bacterium]